MGELLSGYSPASPPPAAAHLGGSPSVPLLPLHDPRPLTPPCRFNHLLPPSLVSSLSRRCRPNPAAAGSRSCADVKAAAVRTQSAFLKPGGVPERRRRSRTQAAFLNPDLREHAAPLSSRRLLSGASGNLHSRWRRNAPPPVPGAGMGIGTRNAGIRSGEELRGPYHSATPLRGGLRGVSVDLLAALSPEGPVVK